VSGGLHGVGISVVNALSEWLEIEIRRQGKVWTQRYEFGAPQGELTAGEKTTKHCTIVRFKPDAKIFEETTFSFDTLSNRLREMAFLNKGLKIVIEDERDGRSHTFLYKGGIIEFIKHLNQNKTPLHPKVLFFVGKKGDTEVEVALLAIVAVATAWSGYQAARWDGRQAFLYGTSSSLHFEAEAAETLGAEQQLQDITTFNTWIQAHQQGDEELADLYVRRFSPEYRIAFDAWLETRPFSNQAAPPGPIFMPEYRNPDAERAAAASRSARRRAPSAPAAGSPAGRGTRPWSRIPCGRRSPR